MTWSTYVSCTYQYFRDVIDFETLKYDWMCNMFCISMVVVKNLHHIDVEEVITKKWYLVAEITVQLRFIYIQMCYFESSNTESFAIGIMFKLCWTLTARLHKYKNDKQNTRSWHHGFWPTTTSHWPFRNLPKDSYFTVSVRANLWRNRSNQLYFYR